MCQLHGVGPPSVLGDRSALRREPGLRIAHGGEGHGCSATNQIGAQLAGLVAACGQFPNSAPAATFAALSTPVGVLRP